MSVEEQKRKSREAARQNVQNDLQRVLDENRGLKRELRLATRTGNSWYVTDRNCLGVLSSRTTRLRLGWTPLDFCLMQQTFSISSGLFVQFCHRFSTFSIFVLVIVLYLYLYLCRPSVTNIKYTAQCAKLVFNGDPKPTCLNCVTVGLESRTQHSETCASNI